MEDNKIQELFSKAFNAVVGKRPFKIPPPIPQDVRDFLEKVAILCILLTEEDLCNPKKEFVKDRSVAPRHNINHRRTKKKKR